MAITLVGTNTYTVDEDPASTTVTYPGPTATDDLVFIMLATDNGTSSTTPTGFTVLTDQSTNDLPSYAIYYRRLTSAETSVSVTGMAGPSPGFYTAILCANFRGVDTTTPFDGVTPVTASGGTGDPNPASITTGTDNAAVVDFSSIDDDNVTSASNADLDNVTYIGASDPGGNHASIVFGWKVRATAGAFDIGTYTTSADDAWNSYTISLRQAPTGYGNDVIGVASANIGKVCGVATANITSVNGVT